MNSLFRYALPVAGACALAAADVNLADGISASEAVDLALRRSPRLLVLHRAKAVEEGGVAAAKILPDPEIRTGRFDFDDDSGRIWSQNYSVSLRWSPPRPGERSLKGESAQGKVSEAAARIALGEQQLATQVRLLHMDVVFLDEQIRLAEASVRIHERIVEFLAAQVASGVKTALDQSTAELELAEARALVARARLDRRLASARLARELGLPRSEDVSIQADEELLRFAPRQYDAVELTETALARRPELAALAARCTQAGAALDMRKQERYPWLSFAQVSRELGGPGNLNTWGVRVGIDLPVFKWTSALLQGPKAELDQCRTEVEAERTRIGLEVEELLERLRARSRELEYLRENVEPVFAQAVEQAERAIAVGQADQERRLAAEARLLAQRQSQLSRLHDYRRLEIELDQALGAAVSP
ncbi:MAG: TolC family protein [Bryobacteraceae bacterium]